ncbi:hypothetical protein D9619_011067 [Psilocybe cf. subviscida]|uniref:Uncharacterized protein n=1 Tax=Psilocybe cf. subviscida TaxID=2480587 RepID=A0A8H5EZW6_9AGAR|nr:hypothetical protein D9619_011067 [Psilocybe cf. subviscida]
MQFTAVLAIVAIAIGSAAAATESPGCVDRNGVQFCSGDNSPPVISVGPNGCTSIEIDGVQFCTTARLKTSTVRATSTKTVATVHTTPTTRAPATTTVATAHKKSTVRTTSTVKTATPSSSAKSDCVLIDGVKFCKNCTPVSS